MFRVKVFSGNELIEKESEVQSELEEIYAEGCNNHYPSYMYKDGEMIRSYDPSYDDYLDEVAYRNTCVYCGSTSPDGYCWQSPDGCHAIDDSD